MILERINGPEDIKKISEKELPTLAKEVRSALNSEFRTPNSELIKCRAQHPQFRIPNSEFRIKKAPSGAFSIPKLSRIRF